MTDKTDLIEQIKLHVGFMKAADNPVSDHYHLKEIKRHFIKQACEAIETHPTLNDFCKGKAIKAIRDRFEGEE